MTPLLQADLKRGITNVSPGNMTPTQTEKLGLPKAGRRQSDDGNAPERHVSLRAGVTIRGCERRAPTCAMIRLPLKLHRTAHPQIVPGDNSLERRVRHLSAANS